MNQNTVTREECEAWLEPFSKEKNYVTPQRLARAHLELLENDQSKEKELFTLRTDLRARLTEEQNAKNPTNRDKIRFISSDNDELRSQKAALESQLEVSAANLRTVQAYAEKLESAKEKK